MTSLSNIKEPEHGCKLIAVPAEKLKGGSPYDVEEINGKSTGELIRISKNESIPLTMQLLAFGQYVDFKKFWEKYNKSDSVYFFVVFDK